ncbi:hypothetical protein LXA43DRAFT_29271 [Ganoderma leucocontextum]|nr:hypothetical protein LXA43DRAFT_29271 [Ganoderma leucocontextum]
MMGSSAFFSNFALSHLLICIGVPWFIPGIRLRIGQLLDGRLVWPASLPSSSCGHGRPLSPHPVSLSTLVYHPSVLCAPSPRHRISSHLFCIVHPSLGHSILTLVSSALLSSPPSFVPASHSHSRTLSTPRRPPSARCVQSKGPHGKYCSNNFLYMLYLISHIDCAPAVSHRNMVPFQFNRAALLQLIILRALRMHRALYVQYLQLNYFAFLALVQDDQQYK